MYRFCLLLALAISVPGLFPEPLPPLVIIGCAFFATLLLFIYAKVRHSAVLLLAMLVGGVAWGGGYIHQQLAGQLPVALEGRDIWVQGRISSLMDEQPRRLRFSFTPHSASFSPQFDEPLANFPSHIVLSWYQPPEWAEGLDAGSYLRVQVRLKRPRSFANPGAFDYHLWQLRRGIGAGGYIRPQPGNVELHSLGYTSVRARIRYWVRGFERNNQDLLQALLLGDRSDISADRWQLLRDTGTSHLIAISGLHIGLVAGFAYLLGSFLGRVLALVSPVRAAFCGAVLAIIAAIGYSALAGFSLPTQRALVMLLIVMLARLTGRRFGPAQVLSVALAAVLVYDPLAFYDVGFWLSFGAVATLVLVFAGRLAALPGSRLVALWRPQWVIFIGLAVPLILAFGQVSLISPVANMIAIPVVSLLVVPLLFMAAVVGLGSDFLAQALLLVVDKVLSALFYVLTLLAGLPNINWLTAMSPWVVPLAALAVMGLLLPSALRLRGVSLALLLLAIWLPPAPKPPLAVTVLDVGQALAVVVRAEDKTLVYDTGLRFSENFDTGRDIIADHLRRQGVQRVDTLVLSHDHADHTGGAIGLMQMLPIETVYLGEPLQRSQHWHIQGQSCHKGQRWQWGEASFMFVAYTTGTLRGNNASCVLVIKFRGQLLVLTGDIEAPTEPRIGRVIEEKKHPVFFLTAPHHGSISSSTEAFVSALQPRHTVISSGYGNRHGHPHPEVIERYQAVNSQVYNTATDGAVQFIWHRGDEPRVLAQRRHARRFWYDTAE